MTHAGQSTDVDRRAGCAGSQPEEHLGRDSARSPRRRHRALRLRQVEPRVRHHLRGRTAPIPRVALELREALRRTGVEAGRRLRVRPLAGDLDRAEDDREQPAVNRRHDDRHRQLLEPPLRHDWRPALPAHRRADAEPVGEPDSGSDPVVAGGYRSRAARPRVQGVRRGSRFRVHRDPEEGLPDPGRRWRALVRDSARPADRHLRGDRSRRGRCRAHGRGRRSRRRQPQAREGNQGGHFEHAAGGRRVDAGARDEGGGQGGHRAVLQGTLQRHASLRLRRDRAGVLRVQRSGERVPHVRRPRRRQADPSRPARAGSEAQHPGRLFRQGGVPVQRRHVGTAG